MKPESSPLEQEAKRATEMLKGKVVSEIWRHREGELGIRFTDGTKLFVDHTPTGVEVSIT
jgi:hypothetical protein